jgi:alpha-beta hydrolase superfamily lysophospholipase
MTSEAKSETNDIKSIDTVSLSDNGVSFDVTFLEAVKPSCIVLFSVGSGGNPERHLPLLEALAKHGCNVVAPHFERLASPKPTDEELLLRARRLRLALDRAALPNLPITGIGHSIGATVLVTFAGGQIWMGPGHQLQIEPDERLSRLVLMTPATGFFQAPGALDDFRVPLPLLIWAGTNDVITPPAQATFLKQSLENRVLVDLRVIDGAGHFSFMNTLPPQTIDPLPNREVFLADLAVAICQFVTK